MGPNGDGDDDAGMGGLRPATVEELAAQERSSVASHRRQSSGRPLIIALATACLMISGAGAFALARTGPNATIVQPYGDAAPFGVGYVDGFGEHTPQPGGGPTVSSRSKRPGVAGVVTGVSVGPSTSTGPEVRPSTQPPASLPVPAPVASTVGGNVSAVYWTTTWQGNYDAYVWVYNGGTAETAWEVRIKLPDGATVGSAMAAQRSNVDGTWIFRPSRGSPLPGGRVYLFAFSGSKPDGRFRLRTCTVNGLACVPFS